MSNYEMDGGQFRDTMSSLNYGTVMGQAAKDLMKEMRKEESEYAKGERFKDFLDVADLEDDPELDQIHRDRMLQMRAEQEARMEMGRKGHGQYQEIQEDEFLPTVTGSQLVLVHFYHQDFVRCKVIDKHLQALAPKHFDTRFVKAHAPDFPFFVMKLQVQMLPCIICFNDGKAFDRIVGFEEIGKTDEFKTEQLESRLLTCGILKPKQFRSDDQSDDEDEEAEQKRVSVRASKLKLTEEDEDSDFD
mmetsp:Transcript_12933/g.44909  ORF Transcript_12933/g.44909 Transcript_12933/m.44909 type:complete len:246 (+) Transcript_12933:255-992(+)